MFSTSAALGIAVITAVRVFPDLNSYLFGNVLSIRQVDIAFMLIGGGLVLALMALLYKELVLLAFDPDMARVVGVPTRRLYYLLLAMIGLTVVICLRTLGIILVTALLIIPALDRPPTRHPHPDDDAGGGPGELLSAIAGLLVSYHLQHRLGRQHRPLRRRLLRGQPGHQPPPSPSVDRAGA